MKAVLKVMLPTLLYWPTLSEADGGMTVKWEPFHQHCIIFFALLQKGINFGVTYIDGLTSTLSVQTLLASLLALTLEDFMSTPIRNTH